MNYPSFEQYNQAFQSHQHFLIDDDLKNSIVKKSGLGMPLAISGGFALTYTLERNNKKYAVRCFHKYSKGLEQRYDAISTKLKSLKSDFFVDFEFFKKGIYVNGNAYPIVKMAWAEGKTLGEFLENNHRNKTNLNNLLSSIEKLSTFLLQNNIAHGDIQLGNLMVSNSGNTVKLIDYDGLFTDSISFLGSAELGHINFQHPLRAKENPFNSQLDNFSLITLWLGIRSIIEDDSLWDISQSDSDSLVFKADDFDNPASSKIISLLNNYPSLSRYSKDYIKICSVLKFDQIPILSDFILHNIKLDNIVISSQAQLKTRVYRSPYPVISALDYNQIEKLIGSQVEVIGRITDIKKGWAKNKQPYIFINFKDWKGKAFKINIWKDGLDALSSIPDDSWVGRYVSVKGLIEPVYHNTKLKYSHISISITKNDQITTISSNESEIRLNTKIVDKTSLSSNSDITNMLKQNNTRNQNSYSQIANTSNNPLCKPAQNVNSSTKNQQILDLIKQKQINTQNSSPINKNSSPINKNSSPVNKNSSKPHKSNSIQKYKDSEGFFWVIIVVIGILIFLFRH